MSQALQVKPDELTPAQLKLVTDVIAKNASPDELKLFLYRCKSMGLDPLKPGQIHFIKYNAHTPGTIVVGIEGFRSIAARSGKHVGTKRGVLRNEKGDAIGGWAEVYRSDWKEPARLEVSLTEYTTGKGPWAKMPESMIQKVAEAGALRMAFPDDLGGIYTNEEMDQANRSPLTPDQPGAEDGVTPSDYRVPFGQYRTKSIDELMRDPKIGPERLASYIEYLEGAAKKKGVSIEGDAAEFIERVSDAIALYEHEIANSMRGGEAS
jgi:phage recombination protein Bet